MFKALDLNTGEKKKIETPYYEYSKFYTGSIMPKDFTSFKISSEILPKDFTSFKISSEILPKDFTYKYVFEQRVAGCICGYKIDIKAEFSDLIVYCGRKVLHTLSYSPKRKVEVALLNKEDRYFYVAFKTEKLISVPIFIQLSILHI